MILILQFKKEHEGKELTFKYLLTTTATIKLNYLFMFNVNENMLKNIIM